MLDALSLGTGGRSESLLLCTRPDQPGASSESAEGHDHSPVSAHLVDSRAVEYWLLDAVQELRNFKERTQGFNNNSGIWVWLRWLILSNVITYDRRLQPTGWAAIDLVLDTQNAWDTLIHARNASLEGGQGLARTWSTVMHFANDVGAWAQRLPEGSGVSFTLGASQVLPLQEGGWLATQSRIGDLRFDELAHSGNVGAWCRLQWLLRGGASRGGVLAHASEPTMEEYLVNTAKHAFPSKGATDAVAALLEVTVPWQLVCVFGQDSPELRYIELAGQWNDPAKRQQVIYNNFHTAASLRRL